MGMANLHGYAFESFSTVAADGDSPEDPEGWSGDVNTNVQVGRLRRPS